MMSVADRIRHEIDEYRRRGWGAYICVRQPGWSDGEYLAVLRAARPDLLPGITVGARWVGSLVTGWIWRCTSARPISPDCLTGPLNGRPEHVEQTEAEAWTRAIDHWHGHQQEDR